MKSSSSEDDFVVISLRQKEKKKGNIGSIQSWDIVRKERRAAGLSRAIQSLFQDVSGSVWCFSSNTRATLERRPPVSVNSVCKDLTVLYGARRSGWTWRSPFWILAFACMVALNCQNTSQNASYGCEKFRKLNPIRILLWWTKDSEAVCKHDGHNMRSYLFFNMQNCRLSAWPLHIIEAKKRTQ